MKGQLAPWFYVDSISSFGRNLHRILCQTRQPSNPLPDMLSGGPLGWVPAWGCSASPSPDPVPRFPLCNPLCHGQLDESTRVTVKAKRMMKKS